MRNKKKNSKDVVKYSFEIPIFFQEVRAYLLEYVIKELDKIR